MAVPIGPQPRATPPDAPPPHLKPDPNQALVTLTPITASIGTLLEHGIRNCRCRTPART
ncbi:hypothetical protein BVIET440_10430 [Burkholderia vietnamiensis]|nr:hypothetical protein BVI1335_2940006 [Burkholderia vietnamiensis]